MLIRWVRLVDKWIDRETEEVREKKEDGEERERKKEKERDRERERDQWIVNSLHCTRSSIEILFLLFKYG